MTLKSLKMWSGLVFLVVLSLGVVKVEGAVLVELQVDHPALGANVTYIAQEASFGPVLAVAGVSRRELFFQFRD